MLFKSFVITAFLLTFVAGQNGCGKNRTLVTEKKRLCRSSCNNPYVMYCYGVAPGCYCDEGYASTYGNKCVLPGDCPRKVCFECNKQNEYLEECVYPYQPSCNNKEPLKNFKPSSCHKGCVCDEGYLRNELNNDCVKEEDCPILN